MTTGALVLAAGEGRRFGGTKQLAAAGGRPLLEHALQAVTAVSPRVVVLGHAADEIRAGVDLQGAEPVVCERLARGPVGVAAARARRAGRDRRGARRPRRPAGDHRRRGRRGAAAGGDEDAVRATYGGVPGHPVLLRRALLDRAGELTGDTGFRDLLEGARVRMVEAGHLADPADIDTPEDLEAQHPERCDDVRRLPPLLFPDVAPP